MDLQKAEGKIGSVGTWSEEVTDKGTVKLQVGVEIDLIAELEKLAAKTATPIDDAVIAWVKGALAKLIPVA